jgi:hypothetical protein
MRFRSTCLLLALCISFWRTSPSRSDDRQKTPDSRTASQIQHLIEQLDADARSERTKARDALLDMGPAILPLLPEDRAVASAAARQSLHEIRLRLQREAALASLAPSRVTLKGTYPLQSVLAQIAAQTGNEFNARALGDQLRDRRITVDFRSRSFWSACDSVAKDVWFTYASAPGRRLELIRPNRRSELRPLSVANNGAFRVAVTSASIRPSPGSRTGSALRISWNLMAEPRLRPLFAAIAGHDLHAQMSEAGSVPLGSEAAPARPAIAELRPISPAAKLELSMNEGQEPLLLDTDFEFPANGTANPNIDFGGSFAVEMAAGAKRFVFDNLAAPNQTAQRAGTVAVRLLRVEIPPHGKGDETKVQISVVYDQGGPAFESYRTWIYHNELWLEAKDGRRILPRPLVATQRRDDGGIAVEYNFADVTGSPADYRVVYVAPTLIVQTPVQFQLRSIPTTRVGQQGAQP